MRVAHVITRMILGGAQENTLYNCEDLLQIHGDDVLLITGPSLGPEGSLLDRARDSGVPLCIVDELRREVRLGRDYSAYRKIKQALRSFRPDVVHTHSAKGGMLGRVAGRAAGAPVVVHSVHGAPWYPYQPAIARLAIKSCERYAARYCDHFICVADAMRDQMVAAGVAPPERFTTILSGMDVDPFLQADSQRQRVREQLGFRPEHIVVGKIARLFHLKGHADVIEAASRVVRDSPQVRFLFIGDGMLADELRAQIHGRGLDEYFHFTGLVPPERIPELISAMDMLVHASLREGLARALPQALITGRPVISYDIDGAREVTIPGQTGMLIPPRDINGLAQAIITLASDPEMRAQYGSRGRERYAPLFRHEYMTEQIRALYGQLLEHKQPRQVGSAVVNH